MSVIAFERHPHGPRLRFFGQRSHHGAWGVPMIFFKRTRTVGFILIADDIKDARDWFRGGWQ